MSVEKARRLLGYSPAYSSIAAVKAAVDWLIDNAQVRI